MSELTVDERRFSEIVYELGSANRSYSCIIRPDMARTSGRVSAL